MPPPDNLIDLEREFWTGDEAFYRANLSPDCRMIFPGVGILSREDAIRGIASGPRWRSVDMKDVQVTTLAEEVAVVTYAATARRDGDTTPYRAHVGSVYRTSENGWTLAFHQHTPSASEIGT